MLGDVIQLHHEDGKVNLLHLYSPYKEQLDSKSHLQITLETAREFNYEATPTQWKKIS